MTPELQIHKDRSFCVNVIFHESYTPPLEVWDSPLLDLRWLQCGRKLLEIEASPETINMHPSKITQPLAH